MDKFLLIVALPLAALAGCATTRTAGTGDPAGCQTMANTMGADTTHDNTVKGMGLNSMNLTHERCQKAVGNRP